MAETPSAQTLFGNHEFDDENIAKRLKFDPLWRCMTDPENEELDSTSRNKQVTLIFVEMPVFPVVSGRENDFDVWHSKAFYDHLRPSERLPGMIFKGVGARGTNKRKALWGTEEGENEDPAKIRIFSAAVHIAKILDQRQPMDHTWWGRDWHRLQYLHKIATVELSRSDKYTAKEKITDKIHAKQGLCEVVLQHQTPTGQKKELAFDELYVDEAPDIPSEILLFRDPRVRLVKIGHLLAA